MKLFTGVTLGCCLLASVSHGSDLVVEHRDELFFDERLSLRQVVDTTFERYPNNALISAFQEEVTALDQRSSSWIAGFPMLYLQYIDDALITNYGVSEIQSGYQMPLWMWGQREASQKVADQARKSAEKYIHALKHEIAGLVRDTLWSLRLAENRLTLARQIYDVAEKLTAVVQRRVELGDLARADVLLAESDQLEKKTLLVQAEAELMHARKAYQNLTRMDRAPLRFDEVQSALKHLDERHPSMAAANASVERAQAEVEFTRLSKQGNQPSVLLGTDSTSVDTQRTYGTGTNLVVQVPIGGDDWNAPQVAQSNLLLNEKIAQRETLWRQLEKALHEAQHNLEVDKVALTIAERRKSIAETQLDMSRIAFEAGEIALIDYLKIRSSAYAAIQDHAQRLILVQKDTAVYNQVVGVTP
ncbi:MAG: TolC family protein [Methylococcaceae bacterium]|jgi:cobalt-zinc-cadmium efflux system outer membrane protein